MLQSQLVQISPKKSSVTSYALDKAPSSFWPDNSVGRG